MKTFYEFINESVELNQNSAEAYLGCDLKEAINWCKGVATPTPTEFLYPLDYEILEQGFGDEIKELSEEEVDDWLKSECDWYDGSLESIEGGLNAFGDFLNACGYDYIVGINILDKYIDFTNDYIFIKDANKVKTIFIYDTEEEHFYNPEEFELRVSAKQYNL